MKDFTLQIKSLKDPLLKVGLEVMLLADFVGIKAGLFGHVSDIYETGITITWEPTSEWEEKHPLRDGFDEAEFKFLGFKQNI